MSEPTVIAAPSTAVQPKEVYDLSSEERATWLKTGEVPPKEIKPVKDDSAPSKPAAATEEGAGKTPESGTGKKSDEERNWKQLRETAKQAKEEAEKIRAEFEEYKKQAAAPKDERKDEKAAAPSTAELPKEPERPKRPRLSDHATTDEYEAAMDKYDEAMLRFPAEHAAFATAKAEFDQQQASFQSRRQKIMDAWKGIADKGRELYKDWDSSAFAKDLPIVQHDPVETYLRDSEPEVAAHLLQHLAKNRKDLDRIVGLKAREQFDELREIEKSLRDELGLGGTPTAKPTREAPKKEKEITAAGKPPREIGGTAATAEDEADAALKRGDGDAYRQIMNQREMAKVRAKRKGR